MWADLQSYLQVKRAEPQEYQNMSTAENLRRRTQLLTLRVGDLIDFMRVLHVLGIICNHFETLGEVVQSTAKVGFPSGLVIWEIVDFTAGDCPRL